MAQRKNAAALRESQEWQPRNRPTSPSVDTSKKALHLCLNRLKSARTEAEIRSLTEELQRIVFHAQYRGAGN